MERYLKDLALIPVIKESAQYNSFLNIEQHFPAAFVDNYQSSLMPEFRNAADSSEETAPPVGQNFKMLNQYFNKKPPLMEQSEVRFET